MNPLQRHMQSLNRDGRRALKAEMDAESARFGLALREIPCADWPPVGLPQGLARVWRSRDFLVQEYASVDGVVRLSVNRAGVDGSGRWRQDITWDELQRLKREAGFGEREAVEVFPADVDVVNVANMRHLWVLPEWMRLPFAWRKS